MKATQPAPYQRKAEAKPWTVAVTITGRRATVTTNGPVPDLGFLVTFGEYDGTKMLMLNPFTKDTVQPAPGGISTVSPADDQPAGWRCEDCDE